MRDFAWHDGCHYHLVIGVQGSRYEHAYVCLCTRARVMCVCRMPQRKRRRVGNGVKSGTTIQPGNHIIKASNTKL